MKMKIKKAAYTMIEYGILIAVVVAFLIGVNNYIQRHIQARVKAESDRLLGHGQGLEWGSSVSISSSNTSIRRKEQPGGRAKVTSSAKTTQVTGQAPVPSIRGWSAMEHKGSAIHVQDAASGPTKPDYPDLEYKSWDDRGWPKYF